MDEIMCPLWDEGRCRGCIGYKDGGCSRAHKTSALDLLARAAVLILILAAIVGFSILCLAL